MKKTRWQTIKGPHRGEDVIIVRKSQNLVVFKMVRQHGIKELHHQHPQAFFATHRLK